MPILYKYLWYYDSSCCVCGLVLNTYNIMGNYAVYPARWNFWGGHFWKFAFPSRRGHKNFKSYLFHHLSVPSFENRGGTCFSARAEFFSDEKLSTPVILNCRQVNTAWVYPQYFCIWELSLPLTTNICHINNPIHNNCDGSLTHEWRNRKTKLMKGVQIYLWIQWDPQVELGE